MVVQGLNPGKKQCYFIVYGNQLLLQRSYMGTVAVAKRIGNIHDVKANVVYYDDEFEYEVNLDGGIRVLRHTQKIENIHIDKIKAAYATVIRKDGGRYTELMTISQIRKAWGQGATRGGSPAHRDFPDQMAKKSVINRACKLFITTTDDNDLVSEAFSRTTNNEYAGTDNTDSKPSLDAPRAENENAAQMDALLFGGGDGPAASPAAQAAPQNAADEADAAGPDTPTHEKTAPKDAPAPDREKDAPGGGIARDSGPDAAPDDMNEDALEAEIREVFGA
jgi:recombinational DNA repair protein RecT